MQEFGAHGHEREVRPAEGYHPTSSGFQICDVVIVVRGQEMVVRCPSYTQAVRWARLECKSYKIPEPDWDLQDNEEPDDVPLFLRPDRN